MTFLVVGAVLCAAPATASARDANSSPHISNSPTQVVAEMSDSQAASLVPKLPEDRPDNDADNQRVPTASQLSYFRAHDTSMPSKYLDRIDGDYRGTTSEIIEWAALKWGLDPNLLRAVAAVESWWHMSEIGGPSYGLFQINKTAHCCQSLAEYDTAFNADYYGAIIRSYYDGTQTWLNTVSGNGTKYTAHQLWYSVGYWCAGRWDTPTGAAYVSKVQADLSQEVWLQPNFDGK